MSFRKNQSKAMTEKWKDPEFRDSMIRSNPVLRGEYTGEKNPMHGKGFKGKDNPMYGKKHTEESLEKMRKPRSQETKEAISSSKIGRIWINNGEDSKCVKPEELMKYIDLGWKRGRN